MRLFKGVLVFVNSSEGKGPLEAWEVHDDVPRFIGFDKDGEPLYNVTVKLHRVYSE